MLPHGNSGNKSNKIIYINPNFRGQLSTSGTEIPLQTQSVIPKNAHINPLFLEAHKSRPTIHMNPEFLRKFHEQQVLQQQRHEKEALDINTAPENVESKFLEYQGKVGGSALKRNNETVSSRKIICKSKNRLIREPLIKKECQNKNIAKLLPQSPLLVLSKRKLIRKTPTLSVTLNKTESNCIEDSKLRLTKYKLDNRMIKKKGLLPPTPKIKRTSYVGRYALRRGSMSQSTYSAATKWSLTINKKLHVLNINGLLYKSTKNSLKLKHMGTVCPPSNTALKSSKTSTCNGKSSTNQKIKPNQGLTIFVRGTKYVMDANKFKLTRVTNDDRTSTHLINNTNFSKTSRCQRIDIGGYTYVSVNSAKNILIRTTNHLSRAYVHNAKQKSLQMLTKRWVKTNIPCPIFQRIGKCAAFEREKCFKVHNKLQIAICSKFLRGECLKTNCLLSHNVSLSKMPVCKFFLQGVCVRNDCPYLHKKLSNKAELCIDFLRGFCELADKCDKRHEFVCPEIERCKVCTTKNCIYCSAKRRKELQTEKKANKFTCKDVTETKTAPFAEVADNSSCKRYFIELCDNDKAIKEKTEGDVQFTNEITERHNDCVEETLETSLKNRPKLGALPSYIPL